MGKSVAQKDSIAKLLEASAVSAELNLHTRITDPVKKDDRFYAAECIDREGYVVIDTKTGNMCLAPDVEEAIRRAPK